MRSAEKSPSINERRRRLYATDPAYRARVLQKQRDSYNKDKKLTSKLANGILRDGVEREVEVDGLDGLQTLETFTLRETGEALGKSLLTIRSWIENEIIPEPFCRESSTGYQQYTRFELDILGEILADHETRSQYVTANMIDLIEEIWEDITAVRQGFLEEDVA